MSGIDNNMVFEDLRDALILLIQTEAGTRFRVIGSQKQSFDADEIKDTLRTLQVFFSTGDYPSSGRQIFQHDVTFQLFLSVSSASSGDKATIGDDTATPAARQAALLAVQEAENLVDNSMDELWRMITQILKDPVNIDFGLTSFTVSSPELAAFRKNQVLDKGTLTTLTASATWSATIDETTPGATGVAGVQPVIDATIDEQPLVGDEILDNPKVGMETDQ